MKYEKSCGAVIFRKTKAGDPSDVRGLTGGQDREHPNQGDARRADGWHVLLIRHNKGRHVSFPKGHVEPGETESQTAEREILEETGLRVRVDRRFRAENRYNIRPDTQKLVVIFAAVTDQAEITPQPEEIAEALWVPLDEADERLTYERDRRIMHDAFEHIQAAGGARCRA